MTFGGGKKSFLDPLGIGSSNLLGGFGFDSVKDSLKIPKPKSPEIPDPVILPDPTDITVRRRQMEEMKTLLKRRGRSRTLLSGRDGDRSATAVRQTTIGRS